VNFFLLMQTYYGQEMPKSLRGEQPEIDEESGIICFRLHAREEDPFPFLYNLYPFCFCLCLDIW
jgi:hypothetical protein